MNSNHGKQRRHKHSSQKSLLSLVSLTLLTLIAFAGNSVLCRLAVKEGYIDPASYTNIRLVAGVFALWLIFLFTHKPAKLTVNKNNWLGGISLYLYAITLSYGYLTVETGIGAVVLFGAVQVTLVLFSFIKGHKISLLEWLGLLIAFIGFVYLMADELGQPSLIGLILMTISGITWGIYTQSGLDGLAPIQNTTANFTCTIPLILVSMFLITTEVSLSFQGIILAIISGAVTSAIGYALWYNILPSFTSIQAGVVQLLVPIVAAIGGVIFVNDAITIKLFIASLLVLGGAALVTYGKRA
ncbi:DMT family transporter [Thalassotalea sp. PP2-459]|uniref:DMT family transporter n=1 Tax=Thalassotalea sp. PP2-459 TaxID=1742724 RepID=UPI0011154138|nr:DMT family transporter [Thalassotalea sp. PP2-459]